MERIFSLVAFVLTASLTAAVSERGFCLLFECDMELVGYIFNDPKIIFSYSAIAVVICFVPSVWLSKKIGRKLSTIIIPLTFAVLVALLGFENNAESALIIGLWVFVSLLAGNFVGLLFWPKQFTGMESANA